MQTLTPRHATWDVYRVRDNLSSCPLSRATSCRWSIHFLTALQCYQEEFPDLENVDQYTGIFITGSPVSANETHERWIEKQKQWVVAFAATHRQCKLFASCYGCQVIHLQGNSSSLKAQAAGLACCHLHGLLYCTHKPTVLCSYSGPHSTH